MLELSISPALLAYVEAIHRLGHGGDGEAVHCRDIADALGVHKSTVTAALRTLRQLGLIRYHAYEPVALTATGKRVARRAGDRNAVVFNFLSRVLAVDPDQARTIAPRISSAITGEIEGRMAAFSQSGCNACARKRLA